LRARDRLQAICERHAAATRRPGLE
jgi:hypothetical protein